MLHNFYPVMHTRGLGFLLEHTILA